MLVLSRKAGEKLVIGENIVVEIVKIQGNRITLGVAAPADVKILRGELNQHKVESPKSVDGANVEEATQPSNLLQAS